MFFFPLSRRIQVQRKGVNACLQLGRQQLIDLLMPFDSGYSLKIRAHRSYLEMRLGGWPAVHVTLVENLEILARNSAAQVVLDRCLYAHLMTL